MNKPSSINVFALPNPGNLMFVVVTAYLVAGFITMSGFGFLSYTMTDTIASTLLRHSSNLNFTVNLSKTASLFAIFLPITFLVIAATIIFSKPLFIRFRFSPHDLNDLNKSISSRFKKLLEDFGVENNITLLITERKAPPQIFGLWNPCILLPTSLFSSYTEEQQEALVLHEIAHYKNSDIVTVELLKAAILCLVIETLVWVVLFISSAISLLWSVAVFNHALYSPNDITTLTNLTNLTIETNSVPFLFLILGIVILVFSHRTILTLIERRADLRVRFYSPNHYMGLVTLIAKGTRKPSIWERLLQVGTDRWTRHESLIDPRRLARPNTGFVFLFGIVFGLLGLISPTNLIYPIDLANLPNLDLSIFKQLQLAEVVTRLVFGYFILGWLILTLVSSHIGERTKLQDLFKEIFWYIKMVAVFGAGNSLIIFFFVSPSGGLITYISTILSTLDIPVLMGVYIALWAQNIMLDNYLIIPIMKKRMGLWLVYLPLLIGFIIALTGEILIFINNPSLYSAYFDYLKSGLANKPSLEQSLQLVQLTFSTSTRIPIATRVAYSLGATLGFLIPLFMINIDFNKCCFCGNEVHGKFSANSSCDKCNFPLGQWINGDFETSIQDFNFSKSNFDWKSSAARAMKIKFLLLVFLGALIFSAFLSVKIFSTALIVHTISNILVRILLGIITFVLLAAILGILVLIPFTIIWKDDL